MKQIGRLWAGDVPLAESFWQYAVLYGLLVNLVTSVLFLALVINEANAVLLVLAYAIPVPYNFVIAGAVWRSADRYPGPREHANLARWVTVIWMIILTAT